MGSQNIKSTFQKKQGNVVDINLLLLAMLKKAGMNGYPVILSTREHGLVNDVYPILSKFNYVIVQLLGKEKNYLLDATRSDVKFNELPEYCYNGHARVVNDEMSLLNINPDSLIETNVTTLFISNAVDSQGRKIMNGVLSINLSKPESKQIRNDIQNQNEQYVLEEKNKKMPKGVTLTQLDIKGLNNKEEKLQMKYSISLDPNGEELIYFNPLLDEIQHKNPFKNTKRLIPVELPYCFNSTYVMTMNIPEGYEIEDIPTSTKTMLNEDDASFEYLITHDDNTIQLRNKFNFNKTRYSSEDYDNLRMFFDKIIAKQLEQIVFRKK
jgi:hypothetical protein